VGTRVGDQRGLGAGERQVGGAAAARGAGSLPAAVLDRTVVATAGIAEVAGSMSATLSFVGTVGGCLVSGLGPPPLPGRGGELGQVLVGGTLEQAGGDEGIIPGGKVTVTE